MLNLNQKERMLLEDQKKHEEHCIQKYANYANQAQDPQLRQMFYQHGQHEQQHLATINQIISGNVPMTNQQNQQNQQGQQGQGQQVQQLQQGQSQQNQGGQQGQGTQQNQQGDFQLNQQSSPEFTQGNINDEALCTDILMTEKFISGAYDTAIFEFTDTNVRKALNHIQKEEQQHGEDIFHYMQSKGMYNP